MSLLLTVLAAHFLAQTGSGTQAESWKHDSPEAPRGTTLSRLTRPIDFWAKGLASDAPKRPSPEGLELGPGRILLRETIWAQPVRTPDGNWMLYVPPKPILDFLENPTEETGRAYLAWKSEQAEKLSRAMKLLGRLKEAGSGMPKGEGQEESLESPRKTDLRPGTLLYFKKPSCPHCVTQDSILVQWLPKHPELRLEVILPEEHPEVWKSYGVRGTPTLVLRSGTGKEEILVGRQSDTQLEAAFGHVGTPGLESPPRQEKER